ncbi:variant erythrocyte surface antigen-1 family protein [Babesia caballi]|uniref:Variant erythrocyte surface antigen-1 family protein n=1 Tax=Babesia caballi TaxID=5871 RepID=A0AAV4LUX5_BABCB|nr:variant erythrocyte surface antigen-1 family protein [Babesia caballi]
MTPGKPLTTPPTNLKEAIDWVLRVSGGDGMRNDTDLLATALTASIYKTSNKQSNDVDKILTEMKKDEHNGNPTGPMKQLSDALAEFIGYKYEQSGNPHKWKISGNGVVKDGTYASRGKYTTYTSAYQGSWFTDVFSNDSNYVKRNDCARILFTAIEIIFEGLTELFFNCKSEWDGQSLNGTGGSNLKQFMTTKGFSDTQLNTSITGDKIATQALKGFNEFDAAYNPLPTSLDAFRYHVEQNAISKPSEYPLSMLYIIATYVYVQSSNPATPSFLGYSGTAVLAGGAYGLNLGGLGTFVSALLA